MRSRRRIASGSESSASFSSGGRGSVELITSASRPALGNPGHEALPFVGIVVVEIDHALRELDDALPDLVARGGVALDVGQRVETHQQGGALGERRSETRARHADHDRLLALLAGVDHAHHARDAADRVQVVDAGIFDAGFALGRDDQEAAGAGALQRGERLGPADRERNRDAGEHDQVADRRARAGWQGTSTRS